MIIYKKDIDILKANLLNLPKLWDDKMCVLELKEADYNWRQKNTLLYKRKKN